METEPLVTAESTRYRAEPAALNFAAWWEVEAWDDEEIIDDGEWDDLLRCGK